jgi:hypothetical protein
LAIGSWLVPLDPFENCHPDEAKVLPLADKMQIPSLRLRSESG